MIQVIMCRLITGTKSYETLIGNHYVLPFKCLGLIANYEQCFMGCCTWLQVKKQLSKHRAKVPQDNTCAVYLIGKGLRQGGYWYLRPRLLRGSLLGANTLRETVLGVKALRGSLLRHNALINWNLLRANALIYGDLHLIQRCPIILYTTRSVVMPNIITGLHVYFFFKERDRSL